MLALSVAACSGDGPPPLPNPSSDHTTVVTTPQVLAPTFDPAVPIAPAVTTTGPDLAVPTVGPDVPVDQPVVDVPSVPESGTATPIDGDPVVAPTPTPTPTPNPNPNPNPDPIPHPNPPPTPDPIPPPPPPPPPPPAAPTISDCDLTPHFAEWSHPVLPGAQLMLDFDDGSPAAVESRLQQYGITHSGAIELVPGRHGMALRPMNGAVAIPTGVLLDASHGGTTPLQSGTIALWVASDSFYGTGPAILRLFDADTNATGWNFAVNVPSKNARILQFFAEEKYTGAPTSLSFPIADWTPGEWHHVVLSFERVSGALLTTTRLYLDGRLVATRDVGNFPTGVNMPEHMYLVGSNRKNNPAPASGLLRIDELRSYGSALSADDVGVLYRGGLDVAGPSVASGRTHLYLLGAGDGYGLASIEDSADANQRKTMQNPARRMWQFTVQSIGASPTTLRLDSRAALFAAPTCQKDSDGAVYLRWARVLLPKINATTGALSASGNANEALDVRVTWRPGPNDSVQGQIAVTNTSTVWTVRDVEFPRWGGLGPVHGSGQSTQLVLTGPNLGSLLTDPFHNPRMVMVDSQTNTPGPVWQWSMTYPSTELPMPWVGLVDDDSLHGSVYLAIEDPAAGVKTMAVSNVAPGPLAATANDPGLDLDVVTSVPRAGAAGNSYTPAWQAVIALQDGDWYDLARRYRSFASRQAWFPQAPLAKRTDVPAWIRNVGCIATSSEHSSIATLEQQAQHMGAAPGLILWHYNAWQLGHNFTTPTAIYSTQDNDFPAITPQQPHFGDDVVSAKNAGTPLALYFLPTAWDTWKDQGNGTVAPSMSEWNASLGATGAMRDINGDMIMLGGGKFKSPAPTVATSNADARNQVRMCAGSTVWQEKMRGTISALVSPKLGAQGVYLDTVARMTPTICYDATHDHVPGDPSAYVSDLRTLLTKSRAAAQQVNPQAIFYTEGFSEPYSDVIDGYLTEYLPWWEHSVPIAMVAQHDFTQFVGRNDALQYETTAAIVARQGQFFAWGGMPGFITYGLQTATAKAQDLRVYLMNLAEARREWKKFLVDGEMLHPIAVGDGAVEKSLPDQSLPLNEPDTGRQIMTPVVESSVWRAPDGHVGILLVSLENAGVVRKVAVPLDPAALGITPQQVSVHRVQQPTTSQKIGATITVTLAPREAVLLELQ